ncbi:MAG: NAD(P)H-hydrate dehydratase, partial [Pseudomonadota bacterium]
TGLSRPLAGVDQFAAFTERAVLDARSQKDRRTWPETTVVAIDVPSGLCADAGRYLESGTHAGRHVPVMAHLTVTFHTLKTGHVQEEAPQRCGTVVVVDIGLPAGGPANGVRSARVDVEALGKGLPHKYSYGHALVLSGGVGHGGAARLAARGALRVGAGLVTVGAPPAALIENAAQLNAVMLKRVADPEVLGTVLEDARINALCLGPGMGVTARTREMVLTALGSGRSCVLDADALTVFAEAPEVLFDALHADCVLTPHGGEFARLFPDIAATLAAPATSGPAYSKVDATRAAAARAGCVVLYKGADTVIAGPEGRCAINAAQYARAAPWLATAGSGDVLAGFIAGLLARGSDPFEAAETAAWLHVACARSFGPGLIAEDLPEQIPQVFKALGLS